MDTIFTRLEEASRLGDVISLKNLLEEDKYLLERVTTRTSARDNPLHIAALLGHADFVSEIMSGKPELAKELNGQGLSPLHLATANDHLIAVKELLKAGFDLCLLREEKEGLLPFHIAVIKGRITIAEELLEACNEAMFQLTYGGDTALHLVVKSNSFDMLEFLVSRIQDLNVKDGHGNTILHLAVARKQLRVIKLLMSIPGMDVNSMNSKGHTPLDILFESQHECEDFLIGEMIRAAGGKTTYQQRTSQHILLNSSSRHATQASLNESVRDIEEGNMEPREKTNVREHNADILMVVAILIATITFQAALNPPGGFISGDASAGNSTNVAGRAVFAQDPNMTRFFVLDMIGLFSSISVILLFLCAMPAKKKMIKLFVWILWISTMATVLAFTLAIALIFNREAEIKLSSAWFLLLMVGIVWVAFQLVIFLLKKGEMYKPIQEFFSSLVKRPFTFQRQIATSSTPYWLKIFACLKNIGYILMILFVILIVGCILVVIGFVAFALFVVRPPSDGS